MSRLRAVNLEGLSNEQIIDGVGRLCAVDYAKTGVLASVSIAQMLLESSYLKSELAVKANNCFGMKVYLSGNQWDNSAWDGKSTYKVETKEYINGRYITKGEYFRKYEYVEDSIADHSAYLLNSKNGKKLRYEGIKGEIDPKTVITIIKNGGYATSPVYVESVLSIIKRWDLLRFDVMGEEVRKNMSNSSLVNYTKLSPNRTTPRNHVIDTITIHHMAGNLSVETCGNVFYPVSRRASSNYGIGTDGRIGMYVEEKNRSWCSSNAANDHRAITIEVANDGGESTNWHVSDKAIASLIKLCADICKRNGIEKLLWKNDKSLIGQVSKQNMTIHKWFSATACPGPYLESKMSYIADEVNKLLGSSSSTTETGVEDTSAQVIRALSGTVRISYTGSDGVNIRKAPSYGDNVVQVAKSGIYTVVGISDDGKWYKLKSGYFITTSTSYVVFTATPLINVSNESFKVSVIDKMLKIRKGPGTGYAWNRKYTGMGIFTVVETQQGDGSKSGWGLLKSYQSGRDGWISLDFCTKM